MSGSWKRYRHRFVPWLALNWPTRLVKYADSRTSEAKEAVALAQLRTVLPLLDHVQPVLTPKDCKRLLREPAGLLDHHKRGRRVVRDVCGWSLELRESGLRGGGRGVFVKEGVLPEGQLVCLYPGTVYLPSQPIFFQSIRNPFIFRCVDGWLIDGNHRGLSRLLHKSCGYRDVIGQWVSCDLTWLTTTPMNPLSVGQFVNNHTREINANVEYIEVSIPADFPFQWRRLLPNVFYEAQLHTVPMRCVAVLSTRRIHGGEELFSSYLTVVTG